MSFRCSKCGETHSLEDVSFSFDRPLQWDLLTEEEDDGSELGEETCIIKTKTETHYFLRVCLEIPVIGLSKPFTWGVWVSLSEKSFNEVNDYWDNPDRVNIGPHFGWLCSYLPYYPDTMFLKTMVHQQPLDQRPLIKLEPTKHKLSKHYHKGIKQKELEKIIVLILHDKDEISQNKHLPTE